ncbi:MAG: hypothetical protein H7841_10085 [Magnetospirillum sp. WYHS-4]
MAADPAGGDALVIAIADILHGDRYEHIAVPDPDFRRVAALRRFLPILHRHVRLDEDQNHPSGEVYSPNARDHAQEFRSATIQRLADAQDPEAYDAMIQLAADPCFKRSREWLRAKPFERAKKDAEPRAWKGRDIADYVDRFERLPQTPDELFAVVQGRLADIRENAEQGDFSLKGMFKEDTAEEVFQKLLAERLDGASRGVYQVAREVEVADHKLPDIRVLRAGVGIVTIEVKIAGKWSYNELRQDALETQLVGQYMRIRESRHGILLPVNLTAGRTWRPTGEPAIDFRGLLQRLGDEASELARQRARDERIEVIGIDLS